MPTTCVLAEHDDGSWYLATVRDQYRRRKDGAWWLVVSYYTEPGMQYVRAMPAASCRPLPDLQDDRADVACPGEAVHGAASLPPGVLAGRPHHRAGVHPGGLEWRRANDPPSTHP